MINHATGCNEPNADDRKLKDQSVETSSLQQQTINNKMQGKSSGGSGRNKGRGNPETKRDLRDITTNGKG